MRNVYRFLRKTVGPSLLIVVCPPTAVAIWYVNVALDGSLVALYELLARDGVLATLVSIWGPVFFGSPEAWTILAVFAVLQLLLMRLVPGQRFRGPITRSGHVPEYKANGVACFAVTLALFWAGAYPLGWFPPGILYDHFGAILGALNLCSFLLCLLLYFKGVLAPSGPDHGSSGHPIFDYYWGTELYPRILGWDVKQFTNCRFALMGWALIVISFAAKQHELSGLSDAMLVAVAIQLLYIAKFFYWETGYLASLDIVHDRAGFYICWGCLVWVPAVYMSPTLYLVHHPNELGLTLASTIFVFGAVAVFINYQADAERQRVRETQGRCAVWGRAPYLIPARYARHDGTVENTYLLASGWWGLSRHFHYLPELMAAVFWTMPVLFEHALPWFYVVFLSVLLAHRTLRAERRCAEKYGIAWERYCERVPRLLIPRLL